MKKFYIATIFPEAFNSYLDSSILKRAKEKKIIKVNFLNPRSFAENRHKTVDDRAYGGGPGMVMKAEPILKAVNSILKTKDKKLKTKIILFSTRGKQFTSKIARDYAKKYDNFVLICGHYEGVDERVKKILKADLSAKTSVTAEEISIGPYILTGGELPAMIFIDSVSRHIPGVLGKYGSLEEIKGSYPVYTRPETIKWKGKKYAVPKVLLSGNHKKIEEWRNL